MRVVLKFPVDIREPELSLPVGAKILLVAHEPGMPRWKVTVWAECRVRADGAGRATLLGCDLERREIVVFGTGHIMPSNDSLHHLGSVLTFDAVEGQLVWHVYERKN